MITKTRKITTLLFLLIAASVLGQTPIVTTKNGEVSGKNEEGLLVFKGIPFATPPVGDLRWKAPQPVANWDGVKECTEWSASAFQDDPAPFMCWSEEYLIPKEPISEDCLYLNVWTKSTEKKKPVLVYIHGGGFRSGGAACPIYDGAPMANKDVVFVSINYRVGLFGFLAHPELTAESKNATSGNYALLDMIASLQWVKDNIAAFGGDPDNVTIAGQSAGAFAVNFLTASPLAKGLFHKAIAESGGSFYSGLRPDQSLSQAEAAGLDLGKSLEATNIDALRKVNPEVLQKQRGGSQWPIIDGYTIPKTIYNIFKEGNQNDVPTIMGWNKDDLVGASAHKAAEYKNMLSEQYGALAKDFLKEYPASTDEEALLSQQQIGRDQTFAVQVFTWASMQTTTGKGQVYLYNFNRVSPAHTPDTNFGAFHSSEIPYVYGNLHTSDRPWTAVDHKISSTLLSYWVNFAKSGNPNGENLPNWSVYNSVSDEALVIDDEIKSVLLPDVNKMKLWQQYFNTLK